MTQVARPQRPLSATVPGGLGREPYGARLARELGGTPVYIRDNSGRHISENGRSLADLLEALVAAWPVEVADVALVGHSMGGLVSRSACHLAAKDGSATVTRSPRHPVGRVVGDTLVLKPSASGRSRTRKLGFEDEYGLHLAATNHIALLNHPGVYEKLWEWLR